MFSWHVGARTSVLGNDAAAIACLSASFCVAVSGTSISVFDGSTWTEKRLPRPVSYFGTASIGCPVEGSCVAVTTTVSAIHLSEWCVERSRLGGCHYAPRERGGARPGGISCPSMTFCAVVDAIGTAVTLTGGKWSDRKRWARTWPPSPARRPRPAPCSTRTAGRSPGMGRARRRSRRSLRRGLAGWPLLRLAGILRRDRRTRRRGDVRRVRWARRWRPAPSTSTPSCATASFCLAYNRYDHVFVTLRYGTWSAMASIGGSGDLPLLRERDLLRRRRGSGWRHDLRRLALEPAGPGRRLPPEVALVSSVGLLRRRGLRRQAVTGRAGEWSTPPSIGWGSSVTCASRAFCMAVDGSGTRGATTARAGAPRARFDDAGGLARLAPKRTPAWPSPGPAT